MLKMNLVTFILLIILIGIAAAEAVPSVSILPSEQTVKTNDTFVIGVYLDPAGGSVSAAEIDLSFDARAFQVKSITKGDVLGTDSITVGMKYNNTAGTITMPLAQIGETPDVSPAGYFANVTFKVNSNAASGKYFINIASIELADRDFNDIIGIASYNGSITLLSPINQSYAGMGGKSIDNATDIKVNNRSMIGDINGDCRVDFKDVAIIGAAYGRSKGDRDYREDADLNGDSKIDKGELTMLGVDYGNTC